MNAPNDSTEERLTVSEESRNTGNLVNLVQRFGAANLELLMDVELDVMLQFGKRQANLREVLELTPGAVLELDRAVHDPVDLVLNDHVIARGEVVIVDGNFALKVTEVSPARERLSSL